MEDTQKQNRIRTAAVAPDAALDPQNDAGISPDWQATLASTLSMADVQAAGPPPLGEFQPGDPPLTTGPLSKDSPIKKSRVKRADSTIPTIEVPAKSQEIERRVNPEDERLPANLEWMGSIVYAVEHKIDQFNLWRSTLSSRSASSLGGMVNAVAETRESILNRRSADFQKREMHHAHVLARLDNSSGIWTLPVARSIVSMQTVYHKWREGVNGKKGARVDSAAERAGSIAATADTFKSRHDNEIAMRVGIVNKKWEGKIDMIRAPRDRIDARIVELDETIRDHEALISSVRTKVAALENITGGNKAKRKAQLKNLFGSLAAEEAALQNSHDLFRRAHGHRIRLAAGQDMAEGSIKAINAGYDTHERQNVPSAPENAQTNPDPTSTEEEIGWSMRELAEQKGDITNEQLGRLWDKTFPGAKLLNGYKTLVAIIKEASPTRTIDDKGDSRMKIQNVFSDLEALHTASPTFQNLTKLAVGTSGKKGIAALLMRLENKLARTDITTL